MDALEDQGFFTVDNLPAPMLPALASLVGGRSSEERDVAAVVDARSEALLTELPSAIRALRDQGVRLTVLFMEASEETLIRRYRFTRRRHPFGFKESLLDGIRAERQMLHAVRQLADLVIDTTRFDAAELKRHVLSLIDKGKESVDVLVTSFGFKYGNPADADFLFDVRFLANPYYEPELKDKSGLDEPVRQYIFERSPANEFLCSCYDLLASILHVCHNSGKNYIHVALGCTGGRHRSVFAAEWLAERLSQLPGVTVNVNHRYLKRGSGSELISG